MSMLATEPGVDLRKPSDLGRLLVVDDHPKARESMIDILKQAGHQVDGCSSAIEALQMIPQSAYDVIVTDLKMPGMSGLEFIKALGERNNDASLIVVTAHATVSSAVEAMRHGALDYIEKPFGADQLEAVVGRALRLDNDRAAIPVAVGSEIGVTMIGSSPAMQAMRAKIAHVAATSETVLISGESGTGKELVAHSIHAASNRSGRQIISVNCPALSAQLMESELFGHERGAFTSADAPRVGRFELSDAGTILLDEVTEIDLMLQAKLLRVLQEKTFERVGSSRTQQVDVRVLATTNRDLTAEVEKGRFREDLYYRIAVVPLQVPPLRNRPEDIAVLGEYFLKQTADRLHREPQSLDQGACDLLQNYHWPGNVRELQNIITRAGVLTPVDVISADQFQPWLIHADGPAADFEKEIPVGLSMQEMERKLIIATLDHFNGHRAKTAEALGIGIRTLSGKMRSYGYAPRAKSLDSIA